MLNTSNISISEHNSSYDYTYRKKDRNMKIYSHSMLFFLQTVVFTMGNTIYFEIFTNLGILKLDEKEKTAHLVSYLVGSFYAGKLLSDPMWGIIRDKIGDKKSITLISCLIFISLILFGLSRSIIKLCFSISFAGLVSGIFVPGSAFTNWIEPESRDYLSMWIFIFSGGGILAGPFIGSLLMHYMPYPKILFTWGFVGILVLIGLFVFLYAFRDFDDSILIAESSYSLLEEGDREIERESINRTPQKNDLDQKRASTHLKQPVVQNDRETLHRSAPRPRVRFQVEKNSEEIEFENQFKKKESEQLKLLRSRKKVSKMSIFEIILKNSPRRNLILVMALTYAVKTIDWIVFVIWAEFEFDKGGMGFSSLEAGAVSILSFPMVSFFLVSCFDVTKSGLHSSWLFYTNLAIAGSMLLLPLFSLLHLKHENMLFISIIVIGLKEGAFLVFQTSWNLLMTKIFPSKSLGRAFSSGYLIGHICVLIYSQIFPRFLSYVMISDDFYATFGVLRFSFYFLLLGLPSLLSAILCYYMKITLKKNDGIEI